jgi:hypothetical protein
MTHIGKNTQGQPFFLALISVFQTPPFATCWGDFKVETALVEELGGLPGGPDIPNGGVGKAHIGGNSS